MKISKFQAAGNDFILINNMRKDVDHSGDLAKKLCHRKFGAGADGMIVVEPSGSDFEMVFYNADGSIGEMCGNGARSVARFAFEEGIATDHMEFMTLAGKVFAERISEDIFKVKINRVTKFIPDFKVDLGEEYTGTYIELGNPGLPHFVLEADNVTPDDKLYELGKKLRYAKEFPKGANINFYKKTGEGEVSAITYERGVEDFTLACGTGASSISFALTGKGETQVQMPGGKLTVNIDEAIYLTGEAYRIYDTEISEEYLSKLSF